MEYYGLEVHKLSITYSAMNQEGCVMAVGSTPAR
jgi:hypothetical protein